MSPASSPKPPRRRWKWLKRFFLFFALLLVLLVAFHRPILLGVVRWIGPKGAESLGLKLDWLVDGSLLGDFKITNLKTGGGEEHWIPEVTIGELSADYSTRALIRQDFEHAVNAFTLHDVQARVDLRKLPKSEPPVELPKKTATGGPPPLVWPKRIDLNNINADVTLADGSRLILRGLTLQIGEGMPGIFRIAEFKQEPNGLTLTDLAADVAWEPRKVTIRNLRLPKDVALQELAVDLTGYETGKVISHLLAGLGAASFEVNSSASGLFEAPLLVEADITGKDLRSDELTTFGLPKDVTFNGTNLTVKVKGDPLTPPKLDVDVTMNVANIRAAGAQIDQVSVELGVHDGRAELKSAKVTRGSNVLEAKANAVLPADIAEWQKTTWTATTEANLPEATQFLEKPPAAKGLITLKAQAEGTGATPTNITGQVTGDTLAFETYKLPKFLSNFAINGKQAKLEIPPLELGTGNLFSLNATLLMDDAMPVDATWSLKLADPMGLMKTTGLPPPPNPVKAIVDLSGKAQFKVKEVSEQNLANLLADVALNVRDVAYGEGQIKGVDLKVHAEKGKATVKPLTVVIDASNRIELEGDAALAKPHAFHASGNITLPELTALNSLLKSFGAPPIESGAVFSRLDASGQIQPWLCDGKVNLTATKVRTAQMPEAADAMVETTFSGTKADLSKLEATLGPWKVAAKGTVDDKRADLAELKVWQKSTLLMNGHVKAPFDIMDPKVSKGDPVDVVINAKDLNFSEVLAAAGIKDVPAGVLNADIAVGGRLDSLNGKVKVNLSNVKVPQAPKAFTPATIDLDTTLKDKRIQAALKVLQPPLQPLTVDASLPFDAVAIVKAPQELNNAPIKATVRIPESDLGFVREYAPEMIRSISARMKLDADVSGTVALPIVKANMEVDSSEVSWVSPDMPSVRNVRVRIRTNDRKVTIEDVSAILAGGRVQMRGNVDAADPKKPLFDLKVEAREALVFRDPTTSVRANADLSCRGDLAVARVQGLVEIVRGRVFKEIDLLPALGLPTDVPDVPPDTQRSQSGLTLPPIVKDWTFDIRVKTRDPVLLSGNLVNGAISADVHMGGNGATPMLTGAANIDRMLLKLPFSMVKITKGVVTVNPAKPFDPQLDIRGESRMGQNEITLYIYGDSSNPKTRFTSSPPMSEPNIVTLLATGTTLDGSASELASEAATRAAFLFVSELYRKTFNKKKVVREEPPKLNLTFNPSGADRSNDAVQASYDLTEQWRLAARFTQTGRVRAALSYLLRFGKAAQAVEEDKKKP